MQEITLLEELDFKYTLNLQKVGDEVLQSNVHSINYYSINAANEVERLSLRNTYVDDDDNALSELYSIIECLTSLKELSLIGFGINDLSALKNLKNLTHLNLSENEITNLSPISHLKSITHLYLSENNISNINPLKSLTNLIEIFALDNEIEDINCLSFIKTLKRINFSSNKIKNLKIFNKVNDIELAWFFSNHIEYISGKIFAPKLVALGLGKNNISKIDFIKNFTSLNEIQLVDNKIIDISPLGELTELESIRLNNNYIHDISPLESISNLERLFLDNNLVVDISPIVKNISITSLQLSRNNIHDISGIENLKYLEKIDLSNNFITDIYPIKYLEYLKNVSFTNNAIEEFPEWILLLNINISWARTSRKADGIYLYGNPIKNIPIDILKKGRESIQRHLDRISQEGKDYIHEAKIILLGEGSSGKTSLIKRLINNKASLPRQDKRTRGIEINDWCFKETELQKHVAHAWDFGGQDVYYPVHRFFITENSVFILLASTRQTYHNFDYWIPTIQQFGGNSPIIIGQTCHEGNSISWNDLGEYIGNKDFNIIKTQERPYYEINLPDNNRGLQKIKTVIEEQIVNLPHYGQGVSKSWGKMRDRLNDLSKITSCITFDFFESEYKKSSFNSPSNYDDIIDCCQFLHDIGVVLWYAKNEYLKDWVILQPEWAMNAVYKIIDDTEIQNRNGNIISHDFDRLWNDKSYQNKHTILKKMLEIFKIAFPKKHRIQDYLIPARLLSMPNSSNWQNTGPYLQLEYTYEFMPRGLVNQISAELSRYILREDEIWNNAVNFYFDNETSKCQVIENFHHRKITIKSTGRDARSLIYLVKNTLDNINEEYRGVSPDINVPCICSECVSCEFPFMFSYNKLLKWSTKKDIIYCNESNEKVSINELLYNVGLPGSFIDNNSSETMKKTITLFLASSQELKADREQFELFINRENKILHDKGIFLKLEIWEDFINAMSATRLQDSYNEVIKDCDIFISLFYTKVGKFTLEEFEVAYKTFISSGKPYVYTYFKDDQISLSSLKEKDINSRFRFIKRVEKLGHFPTTYTSIDNLKHEFKSQLDKLLPNLV